MSGNTNLAFPPAPSTSTSVASSARATLAEKPSACNDSCSPSKAVYVFLSPLACPSSQFNSPQNGFRRWRYRSTHL